MNFQQLRFVREAVPQNMNLTEVANVLSIRRSRAYRSRSRISRTSSASTSSSAAASV